ncbi:MAG TPA: SpoIIE family protein phosphatase [Terriglobales bacterium]|nr:SpoIIE family protein phosphatase [Terriglobales bacterium]
MPIRISLPRPFLWGLAVLLAAVAILYGSLWMYYVRRPGNLVELGFNQTHNVQYDEKTHSIAVGDVVPGSPAERAGLRPGDRIVGVNGQRLDTAAPFDEAWARGRPGDPVELAIERPGEAKPLILHGVFRASTLVREGLAKTSALQIIGSFPVLFLVVGFVVLFLRLDDPYAWLLALVFCGFVAAPGILNQSAMPPALRAFAFAYRAVLWGMFPSLFYTFFAVFPARSPLERGFPWLKWASLALGVFRGLPGLRTGDPRWPIMLTQLVGARVAHVMGLALTYAFFALGMISLAGNGLGATSSPEVRRKSRVILWGTFVGVLPIVIERAAVDFAGFQPSFWLNTALNVVLILYPLSFAYAVVKHRVLEIPVLLRRSARYVLVQRGFIVLLFIAAATAIALFTHTFSRFFRTDSNIGMAVSAVFGIVLVWASAPMVKRGTERIDRAFFRSAYDARIILQDLAEKTRTVTDRHELASLLQGHIQGALHPKSFACYLEAGDSQLVAECGVSLPQLATISPALPILRKLARWGKAWDVPPPEAEAAAEAMALSALSPECLVPILGRDSRLLGLLVLGQRRSEEPYSDEDKRLLDSVANQAGVALENIRLAEKMAERMEAEHRAAREMEIARQVQSKLLPQKAPALATLDYAGTCIQARAVGGDYYDFLELGLGRVGFVLADIAGKGMSAALLMANLQAHLRSQSAILVQDLPRSLRSVNRMFYESTEPSNYATLFLGVYEDATRRLWYANCGHNPPLLLRGESIEHLVATVTVLGLFEEWECVVAETQLAPGDILAIYTDGIVEAMNASQEEFGEARLARALRENRHLDAPGLLQAVLAAVQEFAAGEQSDDLTLLVARARSGEGGLRHA